MTAKFSQNIRSFTSNSFINTLQSKSPDAWLPNTHYNLGDVRIFGTNKYSALASGLSGITPPTHISGIQSDGGITWIYVEQMTQDNTYIGNLFLFLGKTSAWADENTPDAPNVSSEGDSDTLSNIITVKNITSNNARIAATRFNWESGTVYSQFDPSKDVFEANAYPTPYYIVTDEFKIYKCLDNNNGSASLSKPISTGVNPIVLADGYSWKFLAQITSQDAATFITTDFIPVKYLIQNDSSDQWNTQQSAQVNSISTFQLKKQTGTFVTTNVSVQGTGSNVSVDVRKNTDNTIKQVLAIECGAGYGKETYAIIKENGVPGFGATATASISGGIITGISIDSAGTGYENAVVLIVGDGNNGAATASISVSSTINSIAVTNGGTGYTYAKVFIIPGVAGAVAKAVLAPYAGHGHNIVSELGATAVLLSIRIETNPHLLTGPTSDFRQIGIITDLLETTNIPAYLNYYIGPAHPSYSDTGSVLHKIKAGSGYILYLSNIKATLRADSQEELIKLAILF